MKIKILKVSGSTFIYWLIAFAILCLIIAIVIQINDRVDPKLRSACIENLKQIERDKISFIINTHTTNNALVMEGIYETKPFCPVGGVYTLGGVNVTPTCSIPGHYIWKPEPRSLGTLKIDNCSYINIRG